MEVEYYYYIVLSTISIGILSVGAVFAMFFMRHDKTKDRSRLIYIWWPIILAKELFKSFIQAVRY